MAVKHFFWLRHPHPHTRETDPDRVDNPIQEKRIEVDGRTLGEHLKELKLSGLRSGCRVIRMRDRQPLRHYYVPASGDVIQMTRS